MDWQEEYKRKLVSAEEAVKTIKSGDLVYIHNQHNPELLIKALFARRNKLNDVKIWGWGADVDPGWYQPGWEDTFPTVVDVFVSDVNRPAMDAHRADYYPHSFDNQFKAEERPDERRDLDVLLTVVSPPDKNGFCSFGYSLWYKKFQAGIAKKVIAEVDNNYIRTYGDNFIHVSEIDCFVEHTPLRWTCADVEQALAAIEDGERREKLRRVIDTVVPGRRWHIVPRILRMSNEALNASLPAYFTAAEPAEVERRICELVASLIHDGDTFELGGAGFMLPHMERFLANKVDLGFHSEIGGTSFVELVKGGVITGKRKNIHPGKAVLAAHPLASLEDLEYMDNNPIFEMYDSRYVINIKTIAANDNMVALNHALAIDFTGQINAETVPGSRLFSGPGGLPAMHMGAVLSKGGRGVTVVTSTTLHGTISRIVPLLEQGSVVTVPRNFADHVVTEYGVAKLMGLTVRERAEALINIAHPDFRAELRKAARKLFYP